MQNSVVLDDNRKYDLKLKPEQELVLLLANFRKPQKKHIQELLDSVLDWAEVFGYLGFYRTAGLAYYVLQKCMPLERNINGDFLLALYMNFEIQKLRTLASRKYIVEVSNAFNKKGIRYAFLKGSVLAVSTYPLGCRASNDIDLLVNSSDLTACSEALQELGLVQGFYSIDKNKIVPATRREIINHRINYGEIVPFLKQINDPGLNLVTVDVNFSLNEVALHTKDAVTAFLQEEQYYVIEDGHKVRTMLLEYFLAHLCVHLFKEASILEWVRGQRDLSLYKYVDVFAVVTDPNYSVNWDRFVQVVKENNITRECFYALYYTSKFFPQLQEDKTFMDSLGRIIPDDTGYLEEVTDAANPGVKYRWKIDMFSRLFDMKRSQHLEQVIEEK